MTNTGNASFEPNPANAVTAIDSQSHGYQVATYQIEGCPMVQNLTSLAPGESMDGCITFSVPTGTTIARVQYQPLSVGSASTAEWQVP